MKNYHSLNSNLPFNKDSFGKDFIWGISSASPSKTNIISQRGDFTEDYTVDITFIKQLGIKNYKFSISWAVLLPEGTGTISQQGLDYYNNIINTCLANGIEPFVTLHQYDLPSIISEKGGWMNRDIITWFTEFITVCTHTFKDRVKNWIIFDNLFYSTGAAYFFGIQNTEKKRLHHFLPILHHLLLCQSIGYKTIKHLSPSSFVGISIYSISITPKLYSERDIKAASRIDALVNRLFIEPSLGLGYPTDELTFLKGINKCFLAGDEELLKANFDFIGLQCYTREVVEHNSYSPYLNAKIVSAKKRNVVTTNMNWEIYPKAIINVIKKFSQYNGVNTIIITGNGASFSDELANEKVQDFKRISFLEEHLRELLKAKEVSAKVIGYFVSSLHDNLKGADDKTERYGLVHTDFSTNKKTIKDSGFWYSRFLSGKTRIN
jgi:beta-glucosidase